MDHHTTAIRPKQPLGYVLCIPAALLMATLLLSAALLFIPPLLILVIGLWLIALPLLVPAAALSSTVALFFLHREPTPARRWLFAALHIAIVIACMFLMSFMINEWQHGGFFHAES
jgi:hypothetical protein